VSTDVRGELHNTPIAELAEREKEKKRLCLSAFNLMKSPALYGLPRLSDTVEMDSPTIHCRYDFMR